VFLEPTADKNGRREDTECNVNIFDANDSADCHVFVLSFPENKHHKRVTARAVAQPRYHVPIPRYSAAATRFWTHRLKMRLLPQSFYALHPANVIKILLS